MNTKLLKLSWSIYEHYVCIFALLIALSIVDFTSFKLHFSNQKD